MNKLVHSISNDTTQKLELIIEPWGEAFEMSPGKQLTVEVFEIQGDSIIQTSMEDKFIVFAPSGGHIKIWDSTTLLRELTV